MWGNLHLLRTLSGRRSSQTAAIVDVMIQASPQGGMDACDSPEADLGHPVITTAIDCYQAVETHDGCAYRGVLDPSTRAVEAGADGSMPCLQIGVNPGAEAPSVVTGTVRIKVSPAVTITVSIQPQAMHDNKILVKDVSGVVALLQ